MSGSRKVSLTGECKRPNACCMVRVQGGEARLQVPAAHPIRAGLATQERLGFKGQARPLVDGGLGRAEVSPMVLTDPCRENHRLLGNG